MNIEDKNNYWYMYELPDIKNRIIILNIEVTKKTEGEKIFELCAREMVNGLLTENKFHSFLKPKYKISEDFIKLHKIPQKIFEYTSEEEKSILQNFLKFIDNSLIISHNASYDMEKINKELEYNDLPLIDKFRFRCSMRIFLERFSFSKKFIGLKETCKYLNIKYNKKNAHTTVYQSLILGKIVEKIYENINNNKNLENAFGKNNVEKNKIGINKRKIIKNEKNIKKKIKNSEIIDLKENPSKRKRKKFLGIKRKEIIIIK